jgi:hypothetical protein
MLASLSSANAAKITKITPHVLTTLGPTTSISGVGVGQLGESQSGSVLSSTSKAGAVNGRGGLSGSTGIWEISSGIFGLFVGFLSVYL